MREVQFACTTTMDRKFKLTSHCFLRVRLAATPSMQQLIRCDKPSSARFSAMFAATAANQSTYLSGWMGLNSVDSSYFRWEA